MDRQQQLIQKVRNSGTLLERIDEAGRRIWKMCSDGRGPKMSIPVQATDDDFYICQTLEDAKSAITVMLYERPKTPRFHRLVK